MTQYKVHARRWAKGWELHIDGIGVTQCRTLNKATQEAHDYIASLDNVYESDIQVVVDIELGQIRDDIDEMRRLQKHAEEEQLKAARERRRIARELRSRGFSVADIASVMDVSRGRVSQLVD